MSSTLPLVIVNKIKTASKEPGVYIFHSKNKPLYVGKAANLRNRLKSYLKVTDTKTESLHEEATRLEYLPLRSEIEALMEESRLIKELKPKYNILWRDDKSYHYVAFTREKFPKIFITHKSLNPKRYTLKPYLIGPFTDGNALRLVMRLVRRYFPYCTCAQSHFRECLNAQIGKCTGFCCKRDANAEMPTHDRDMIYKRNIGVIKAILRGQSKKLLQSIDNEQEKEALNKVFQHQPYLASGDSLSARRVECYDISNMAGKEAVGAMTALVKKDGAWLPDKNSYRKFKIKFALTRDDPRMMAEVLSRRFRHTEWPYPDLAIIDGGITQYNAAKRVAPKSVRVISFAKPEQKIIGWENPPAELRKLVEQAIYQTHNFVIRYHRHLRRKAMFN